MAPAASRPEKAEIHAAGDDLARLRRLAEEGRRGPLLGGPYFLLWGVIIAAAALYHYLLVAGAIAAPAWSLAAVWFGLGAIGIAASIALGSARRAPPRSASVGNRVEGAIWNSAGAFFVIMALGIFLFANFTAPGWIDEPFLLFAVMPPLTFGVYAVAISASVAAQEVRPLKPYVPLSLVFAAATVLLMGRPVQYLVFALGIVIVSILPGLQLLRRQHG